MTRLISVLTLTLVSFTLFAGTVTANAADATVYVVHGIPDVAVDVAVDGDCAIENFMFGDQVGPIMLPAGDHTITITVDDEMGPCEGGFVFEATVPFMADENVTVIAYLDEMGDPTAGKFDNDFSRTDPGKARLLVHHTAAAPMVDISVARDMDAMFDAAISDFANGDQVVTQLRPGEWYVSIAAAGTTDPVLGPALVELKPFTAYRIFAVGSLADDTLALLPFADPAK
jgi:hypothetical protein